MEPGDGYAGGACDAQDLGGINVIRAINELVTIGALGVYGNPFITLYAFD